MGGQIATKPLMMERDDVWRKRELAEPQDTPQIHAQQNDGYRDVTCRGCSRKLCRWKSGSVEIRCKYCKSLNRIGD